MGTDRGLYACANLSQKGKSPQIWKQIGGEIFAGQSIQSIVIPSWEPYQLYVGTNVGGFKSDADLGSIAGETVEQNGFPKIGIPKK